MNNKSGFLARRTTFRSGYRMFIIPVMLGVIGGLVFFICTPWGIGVGYDSVFYLTAADNFINGLGLSRLDGYHNLLPLTHYPPLYPLILAAGSFLSGWDTVFVARILSALLIVFNVIFVSWLVFRFTMSQLLSLLSALIALSSPILLDVHLMAMSEPLYLVLMLLFVTALNKYLTQSGWLFLILASGLAALAYLTRYVGVSLIAAGGVAILLLGSGKTLQRIRNAFIFSVIGVLPILIWYFRNWQLTGAMTNRTYGFHPPTLLQLQQGAVTISSWLLPISVDPIWRLMVLIIFGAGFFGGIFLWLKRSPAKDRESYRFSILLILISFIYGLLLIASITFFDASTRLNDRILSPVYLLTMVAFLIVVGCSFLKNFKPIHKALIVIVGLTLIGVNAFRSQDILLSMRSQGRGFTSSAWRNSETIAVVDDMSSDIILFSNEAFPIYFLTGKPSNWIPEKVDVVKQQEREGYQTQMDLMRETLMQKNGALVIFDTITQRNVYAPLSELTEDLILWKDTSDGAIYVGP